MRVLGGKLVALGVAVFSAALVACLSPQAPPPSSDDAGNDVLPDAGPAPSEDAGPQDTGAPDTGMDAGVDTGVDAGPTDAGVDSAVPDAGPSCGTDNGGCEANATCAIDGGIVCICNAGYAGDGGTCASDCLTNNGGCDPNATCAIGVAGVLCACVAGYTGNGTSCASNDYTEWPAPADDPPETAYVVSADGVVVIDSVTGLTWQRQLFATPCVADGPGVCTWADANTYCASLDAQGANGLEGVTGWRVPSVVELLSIVNYGDGSPALDTAIFPATPAVAFWAHTIDAASVTQSWIVSFPTGLDTTQTATTPSAVRCVTSSVPAATTPTCGTAGLACCYANSCGPDLTCFSGTCAIASDYLQTVVPDDAPLESSSNVSADGTIVTDGVTGLRWQRDVLANPCPADVDGGPGGVGCTWSDAQAYCASLDSISGGGLGGIASGWRLPSVTELLSLVNYTAGSPSLDTALFPGTPPAVFWAETPSASTAGQAWSVSFASGLNATQSTTTLSAVRCVSAVTSTAASTCGTSSLQCCYAASCGPDLACNASSSLCAVDTNYAQSAVPADAPPEPGYTVSPGGSTVTDGATGLVWQRQLYATPCPVQDPTGAQCPWTAAAAYCASLDAVALGGLSSGWRLPSIAELLSITSYEAVPTIDPAPFPGTPPASFWSETVNAGNAAQGWTQSFATGLNATQPLTSAFDVRCVNSSGATAAPEGCGALGQACCYANSCGAPLLCASGACITDTDYALTLLPPDAPPAAQYTISSDTLTATDSVTGLVWSRSAAGTATQQSASTFCASLDSSSLGGLSAGWRQPSVVELLSIVNYAVASGPFVDPTVFPNVTAAPFWSSTPATSAASAWTVNFSNGQNSLVTTSTASGVVCVNGG